MTYCIGWKTKKSVFLIADTARTSESNHPHSKPQKEVTSFGEAQIGEGGIVVEEFINKIFQIERKVIITYTGLVDLAIEIIEVFKKHFDPAEILKGFNLAIASVRNNMPLQVSFLIGFYYNNAPKLYSFNKNKNMCLLEEQELVQLGSMTSTEYQSLAARFFHEHVLHLKDDELQFYQSLAFFQHLGIHEHTLKYYAGGIYSGIYLNESGSKWIEDSAYILYDKNLSNPTEIRIIGRVQVLVRYDALIHYSTISGTKEFFISSTNNPIYKNEQVHEDIIKLEKQSLSRIFCFLSITDRTIIVIKTNAINCNNYFCEVVDNDGDIRMGLTPKIAHIMKGYAFPTQNFINIFWDYAQKVPYEKEMRADLLKE